MKMVPVTRMLSTLCLNRQHEECLRVAPSGPFAGVECQCGCHKKRGDATPNDRQAAPNLGDNDDLTDMGFA